jgi:hypothetical protein
MPAFTLSSTWPAIGRRGSHVAPTSTSPCPAVRQVHVPHRSTIERLGTTPAIFPSNHGGFLGGEYGQTGDPDPFAAKLRQVLSDRAA